MPRNYVDQDSVRIKPVSFCTVSADLYSGEHFDELEPRRLFPLSGADEYISLLDKEGNEKMIVRSLTALDPESAAAVKGCLSDYYRIPKIEAINECIDKNGSVRFSVVTNYGPCTFNIKNRHADIKLFYGKRVMMKDASDNRYEIPDVNSLDKKSLRIMAEYL